MTKYQRWYDALIERARCRALDVYYETHHVIPKSLGGSNDQSNLVDLTYREHFLAHWLLTKIHLSGKARRSMVFALHCMTFSSAGHRIPTSWQFEVVKRALKDESLKNYRERLLKREKAYWAKRRAEEDRVAGIADRIDKTADGLGLVVRRPEDRLAITKLADDWLRAVPKTKSGRKKLTYMRKHQGIKSMVMPRPPAKTASPTV